MSNYITPALNMPPYMLFPKFLLETALSETARLVYTILLDRTRLSLQNQNYIDNYGHVYIYYTITNIAETIRKSEMTVKTALALLEDNELIKRVHQGVGLPNKIYVRMPMDILPPERNISAIQKENFPYNRQKTVCLEERKLSGIKNDNNKNDILKMREQKGSARGSQKNVYISDEEYEALSAEFTECDEYVERLSLYMTSTGKDYRDHAATIRKWILQDKPKKQERNYDCKEDESL